MKKLIPFFLIALCLSCKKNDNNNPNDLPDSYSNQSVGTSARDILSAARYGSISIQVQYMPGYQLDAAALSNLTAYLDILCNKPDGVTVTQQQVAANGSTLSQDNVEAIEKQDRTAYTGGSNIALYILVTDGAYTTANVLGFAYRNTSICLFGKTIFDNSGSLGETNRTTLESTVLEHETGHLLGLVDLGTPMIKQHQDVAHGNHCNNPNCLMYYAVETTDALGFLVSNPVPQLDSDCRNDLHANGGK